jgi:hypothetical protein
MFVDDFTSVALVVNTISSMLSSLVGVSCTWVRFNQLIHVCQSIFVVLL